MKMKKTCKYGHVFYKSSDCPTCPVCEKLKKPESGFLALLSSPARNGLVRQGIDTLQKLSNFTEKEILKIHGIGKTSLPVLRKSLEEQGLDFKNTGKIPGDEATSEVENYIAQFEPEVREKLRALRQLFFELLPGTEERISYKIPAYRVGKHYLYFAAYKTHIGFYPASGLDEIENEIAPYRARNAKASLHFIHKKPLPLDLIRKVIKLKSKA